MHLFLFISAPFQFVLFISCMVLLWQKFTPPSGPEIAKAAEICSLLVYVLGEKPAFTLTLNCNPNPK